MLFESLQAIFLDIVTVARVVKLFSGVNMKSLWLPLKDIPAQGREFSFTDPAIWEAPRREFGLDYQVEEAIEGSVWVQLQPTGCLIRGRLTGVLRIPCDRCTELARVQLQYEFDEYEEFDEDEEARSAAAELAQIPGGTHGGPKKSQAEQDAPDERLQDDLLRSAGSHWELDVGGLLWEQLLLALPVKPLCRPDCKGICPLCGAELNKGPCQCKQDEGDPRLSVLHGLKISS